ncbi:MAG TPA: hypothetical protein VGQ29_01350 [Gemmatimonadales bacterium]|jgi:uncharacterized membrane protein|nr:hypothetical protein [Gemmatimonadales bacterium]
MNPGEVFALVAVVGGFVFVLRPVVSAIAKRIAGEHRRPGLEPAERDEILTELQAVRQEVAELAERMDFAERLLSKQSEMKR